MSVAAFCAGGVVIVDQAAKTLAARAAPTAHNRALAFGLARGPATVLALSSILMLGLFVLVIGRWTVQLGISPVFPALIAGGGIANAMDRVRLGAVRDFIATPLAVVNVADIAVLGGAVALFLALILRVRSLRVASCHIALEMPRLRATIVCDDRA
jgi:lipoprotein signal peptidase